MVWTRRTRPVDKGWFIRENTKENKTIRGRVYNISKELWEKKQIIFDLQNQSFKFKLSKQTNDNFEYFARRSLAGGGFQRTLKFCFPAKTLA